ncbi:MAG: hypothetical protein GY781_03600 [Gammaproteobacteria bacterium]|nr:hypothetical protein [Gammaproteobacteria bacterium]
MNQSLILFPMIALVAWTFTVLLLIPIQRIKAAYKKQVGPGDFRYGESENVPSEIVLFNRNYMNLLELPVLFYLACVTLYVTNLVDQVFLILSWAYVVLRFIHSLIHILYNNVIHRFIAFGISVFILIILWANLFLAILNVQT